MKEFNTEQLFEWRNSGVQYIGIHHYIPELTADEEISEFIVTPFLALEDAQAFLSEKIDPAYSEEKNAAFFFIDSSEAFEIATGVSTFKFYVSTQLKNSNLSTPAIK